jgi:hypothetical protein
MTIHFSNIPATFKHIRRNASTSFKYWTMKNIPSAELLFDPSSKHSGLLHMTTEEITSRWHNPGTTFGFVRNPYARLVSGFHWTGQRAAERLEQRKQNPNKDYPFSITTDIKILATYKRGFEQWIKQNAKVDFDTSLGPFETLTLFQSPEKQSQLFCFDYVVPDIVIKLENFEEGFVQIQDLVKCHEPMLYLNASEHDNFQSYYSDELRKIVLPWIEEDLDTFKYTFD